VNLFINKIINSAVQIISFTFIPFIWWLITARKKVTFMQWIGLKKPKDIKGSSVLIWTVGVMLAFMPSGVITLYSFKNVEMAASEFAGMGINAIPAIIIYASFNTALPEELLFRGFLLKRMSSKLGFNISNIIQSALFGLLHGIMFFALTGIVQAVLITASTGISAWFMGYINEKKANGSIIPSWSIHTVSNIFSGVYAAFFLV